MAVSQASAVMALHRANPSQSVRQLYRSALGVGHVRPQLRWRSIAPVAEERLEVEVSRAHNQAAAER